jgi:thioredoxin reductase (NADPH)
LRLENERRDGLAEIKLYGTPWCPDCKRSKKFLAEQRVEYDWFDVDADPDALRFVEELQNGGRTIPTILFPDGSHLLEPANDELARKLGLSLKAKQPFYDLVIIGGGPTGLAASIYAAREGIESLVIEKSALGGQAGVTERIDNYPGFPEGVGGGDLADRFIAQARRYGVELLSAVGAKSFEHTGEDLRVTTDSGDTYGAHAVLIATGSGYRRLGVPGEDELIGSAVHYCATCDGPFYKGADELMVIGGGNSGLEEGLFLTQFAKKIVLLEHGPELRASQLLQEKVRNHKQFDVYTNTSVTAFRAIGSKLSAVLAKGSENGRDLVFKPAAAFVFIGLDPNTGFLGNSVALDDRGFVDTNDVFQTSVEGVFAAGDVRAGSTKQLASAVGEGVTALLHIRQYLQRHAHVAKREAA